MTQYAKTLEGGEELRGSNEMELGHDEGRTCCSNERLLLDTSHCLSSITLLRYYQCPGEEVRHLAPPHP